MFWITGIENSPLIETIYFLKEKKGRYPHILINKVNNNIKYNNKTGIILKKKRKIVWEDSSEWILAPKNIELVEGKFKSIRSLSNIDVNVPMKLYLKNPNDFKNKYVNGRICGFGLKENTLNILIGEGYYWNIEPGVLIIKLPKFY